MESIVDILNVSSLMCHRRKELCGTQNRKKQITERTRNVKSAAAKKTVLYRDSVNLERLFCRQRAVLFSFAGTGRHLVAPNKDEWT